VLEKLVLTSTPATGWNPDVMKAPRLPSLSTRKADMPPCSTPYAWADLSETTCQFSIDVANTPSNPLLDTIDGLTVQSKLLLLIATKLQKLFYYWVLSSEVNMGIIHCGQSWIEFMGVNH
jgi:hypothetical protein